jgi:hypothetical protein
MNDFNFVMVSAGFEHGGNVTHRHLDGHPNLLVYPFESQLGNRNFNDFLASVERVQYRYPEFPEGLGPVEYYEQMIDEEMKTFLRKRDASKFKDANLELNEADRLFEFQRLLGNMDFYPRAKVIEAFFRATFITWKNCYTEPSEGKAYVGYSPVIGIDSERIIRDFPGVKIMHIIRNPFSAYSDTKRRPFPQPLNKYLITWNIYHSTVEMFSRMYPSNVRILRYEDLVADKKSFMQEVADFIGVVFSEKMLYPSWNGIEIKDKIAPWGTVLKSTSEYNESIIDELSDAEKAQIVHGTSGLARHFRYDQVDYLTRYYGA